MEEIPPDEYEFTQEIHADGKLPGMRCAAIHYRMVDTLAIETPMQFELRDVHIIPREMPACRNLQYRLDTGPKAQEYGIKVNCTEGSTPGDMQVKLADFNKSVTQEEAQTVLDEIVSGKVTGPWIFTIDHIE